MRAWNAVAAEPWAILEQDLRQILDIAARDTKEDIQAVAAKLGRPLQNTRAVTVRDGVATIPVTGPIFRYANLFTEVSGATSLAVLSTDIETAAMDPAIKAVILKYENSPGGQVQGTGELAARIRELSANKPIVSYVEYLAASGGYWLASAAPRVVMARGASVGSIGVIGGVTLEKLEEGSYEFVSSQSPLKILDPATEEGAARMQARVDSLAAIFIDDVAGFRGVTPETVASDFGQGDVLLAEAAIAAGMADAIGDYETLHRELATGAARSPALGSSRMAAALSPQLNAQENAMSELTAEAVKTEHPAVFAAILAQGAASERARIEGIEANILPGYEKLAAECKADPACTAEMAAVRQVKAQREKGAAWLDAQRQTEKAATTVVNVEPPSGGKATASAAETAKETADLPLDERAKAQWDADAALRSEFSGDFDKYLAFEKRAAKGQARIFKREQ